MNRKAYVKKFSRLFIVDFIASELYAAQNDFQDDGNGISLGDHARSYAYSKHIAMLILKLPHIK